MEDTVQFFLPSKSQEQEQDRHRQNLADQVSDENCIHNHVQSQIGVRHWLRVLFINQIGSTTVPIIIGGGHLPQVSAWGISLSKFLAEWISRDATDRLSALPVSPGG